MIKGLSEGDRIEFKEMLLKAEEKAGKKANIYVSQILEFDDKADVIRVAMPIHKGKLVPLPKGEVFDTFFYTARGLYQCRCRVLDKFKMGNIYVLRVTVETELQKYQRRQYFRLEKTLAILYTELTDKDYIRMLETKSIPEEMASPDRYAEGTVLDISGGGMRFVGRKMIPSDTKVFVIFDLFTSKGQVKFRLPASVIVSFELTNVTGRFEHRIEFENISEEYRDILIKYIFEEERRLRKGIK